MQELTTSQLIETFKNFITACQITIEMPREFNKKWLVFSHYLNIYPMHSIKLIEYSHKCMDPQLEQQFIENNYHELRVNPQSKLKLKNDNSGSQEKILTAIQEISCKQKATVKKGILSENNTFDHQSNYFLSLMKSQTSRNHTNTNKQQQSYGSRLIPQKRGVTKKKFSYQVSGAIKDIIEKMREGTKQFKENEGSCKADQLQPDITRSINLNDSIKKMDANQLKHKILIIKDNMRKEHEKSKQQSTSRDQKSYTLINSNSLQNSSLKIYQKQQSIHETSKQQLLQENNSFTQSNILKIQLQQSLSKIYSQQTLFTQTPPNPVRLYSPQLNEQLILSSRSSKMQPQSARIMK